MQIKDHSSCRADEEGKQRLILCDGRGRNSLTEETEFPDVPLYIFLVVYLCICLIRRGGDTERKARRRERMG